MDELPALLVTCFALSLALDSEILECPDSELEGMI